VQGWVWAFFCASVHGKKKMVLENNFFGGKHQLFGENLVLRRGFGTFDEIS